MSAIDFPPIETVLGIVEDQKKLPLKGKVGEAWYEENAGRLWVWDGELLKWRELNLWKGRGFASSVATLVGLGESSQTKGTLGAIGERGSMGLPGPQGERGPQGPAGALGPAGAMGPAGKDGKNGVDGKNGIDGKNGVDGKPGPAGPAGAMGDRKSVV